MGVVIGVVKRSCKGIEIGVEMGVEIGIEIGIEIGRGALKRASNRRDQSGAAGRHADQFDQAKELGEVCSGSKIKLASASAKTVDGWNAQGSSKPSKNRGLKQTKERAGSVRRGSRLMWLRPG
jgi:hypothetical protein